MKKFIKELLKTSEGDCKSLYGQGAGENFHRELAFYDALTKKPRAYQGFFIRMMN